MVIELSKCMLIRSNIAELVTYIYFVRKTRDPSGDNFRKEKITKTRGHTHVITSAQWPLNPKTDRVTWAFLKFDMRHRACRHGTGV